MSKPGAERLGDAAQQAEQQKRDDHGQQRQQRTHATPKQVRPDERDETHAAASVTSWPLSSCRMRRAWLAAFGSWVTITMVLPCS